jgi:hypothetical protein
VANAPLELIAKVPNLPAHEAQKLAWKAVGHARKDAPKLSGESSKRIVAKWGNGFFGLRWVDSYVWFQEMGIQPFTMTNLAGKTIPMWIDDPTGTMRTKNPKAKTRRTKSGKTQVLIFRKAAKVGTRKPKRTRRTGTWKTVPASYPGAPGRIGSWEAPAPYTRAGKVAGQIAKGNVGVKWRHPGLRARHFLLHGILTAAAEGSVLVKEVVTRDTFGREQPISYS